MQRHRRRGGRRVPRARAKVARWCDPIVQQLLADLQSTRLLPEREAPILSCFEDIALAIGPLFEKYLAPSRPCCSPPRGSR